MITDNRLTMKWRRGMAALSLLLCCLFAPAPSFGAGPPPVITSQPVSQSVPIQGTVSLQVTATSGTTLSYQWHLGAQKAKYGTSSTLTLTNVQSTDAGNYYVIVSNSGGTVTSSNATLTVVPPPTITSQPQNQTVVQGQTVLLSVVASGTALSYQWSFNGSPLTYATNSTLSITNVQLTDSYGSYSVVVTNLAGSAYSTNASLTVIIPPTITSQPQSQTLTLAPNLNATFVVGVSGTYPIGFQWFFNGIRLSAATNTSLQLNNLQATNAGNYKVVVTNFAGSVTSAVALLAFYAAPVITAQPQNQTATQGLTATLSVGATGTPAPSYQWSLNSTNIFGATSATLTLTNVQSANAGSYKVVVSNSVGSVTSSNANLTVLIPATITNQPQNLTLSVGQTASFSVGVSGTAPLRYQWKLGATTLAGATNASLTLTNVQTGQAGNYTVVVTNMAGSVTSSVATLTVNLTPAFTSQPQSQTVAQGQTATFTVQVGGVTPLYYYWYLNGSLVASGSGGSSSTLTLTNVQASSAGNWSVKVYNLYNILSPVTSDLATLTVIVPTTITSQPQSQAVSAGQPANFAVGATGPPPVSYQWNFNNAPIAGATNSTLSLSHAHTNDAGSYTVLVTSGGNSLSSAVASLTVTNPVINLSAAGGGTMGLTPAGFTFQFAVPVGVTYVVLASSDFVNWTPIATNVATTATVVFTDAVAANYPSRVYRLMIP